MIRSGAATDDEAPPPTPAPRQGWEAHFQQIAEEGEDRLLDAASLPLTQWDREEWQW